MSTMDLVAAFASLTPVPWANGAGRTTELVALADSAALTPGLRPWRLSIAQLEVPGPFSSLPGLARTFLPIGAEVALEIDGQVQSVTPQEPARFHGEQAVGLVDLPEPCFALNLMVADPETSSPDASDDVTFDAEDGHEGGVPALRMTFDPTDALFAVTLEADSDHDRFELLRLAPGETLPETVRAAYFS